jgi:hypothetical protein
VYVRVEEQICTAMAGQMLFHVGHVGGEDQPRRIDAPRLRFAPQILLNVRVALPLPFSGDVVRLLSCYFDSA